MIWEVKRDGVVVAWGPEGSMPSAQECKRFRADGYMVFVDGKEVKK